jgi:hypothetical protein
MTRQAWLVLVTAIAGLALAVALAVLTSHLTAQHVGLGGEPSRPASGLVAPIVRKARPAQQPVRKRATSKPAPPSTTTPAPHKSEHEHGDD